jgi:hypothetical protein
MLLEYLAGLMVKLIRNAGPRAGPQPTILNPDIHNAVVLTRRIQSSTKYPNDAQVSRIDPHQIAVVAELHSRVEDHNEYVFEK